MVNQVDLRLTHHAKDALELRRISPPYVQNKGAKPWGLWLSHMGTDGWYAWCSDQEFRLECLVVRNYVDLAPNANILRISNMDDLLAFTHKYTWDAEVTSWIQWERGCPCVPGHKYHTLHR